MRWCSRRVLLAAALVVAVPRDARAQRIREWQVQGLSTFATQRFFGGGLGLGLRPPGRLGLQLGVSGGVLGRAPAVRAEVLTVFRLSPYATKGVRPYGSAGLAVLAREAATDGYITLVLGVESRPGTKSGWFAEVGVGGGVRASAGIRIRRILPAKKKQP